MIALTFALQGCSLGILNPHGPIGRSELTILIDATLIMLAVVGPVICATLIFAWWFRSGNARARRLPDWSYSGRIEFIVWCIPTLVILFLGGIAWIGSRDLDPAAPLHSAAAPTDIEVVSLDWKWLFIYPTQEVASVNRLVIPSGVPLRFRITSAGVMNSFFVPPLGSQIYAMAGMVTRLNLQADSPGTYQGLSTQFSGDGFSDMRFEVETVTPREFAAWIEATRRRGDSLDASAYGGLMRPSSADAPHTFGTVSHGLFESIVSHPGAAPPARQGVTADLPP